MDGTAERRTPDSARAGETYMIEQANGTAERRTLDSARAGETCVIVRAEDGTGRLAPMGFIPGETVEVLRRGRYASVVRVRGMRLALGCEVTRRITVRTQGNG